MTKDNPLNLPISHGYLHGTEPAYILADKYGAVVGKIPSKEHALYIVRCCNMHQELVSMLERILENNMVFETSKIEELLERAKG